MVHTLEGPCTHPECIVHAHRVKTINWGAGTVQIVFIYPASLDTRPPSFLGETSCASRRMAGGAPTTYGRHWDVFQKSGASASQVGRDAGRTSLE